jgi:Tfp pilus assembly protein PilF
VHFFPAAHLQLGIALEGMEETRRAIQSIEVAVRMQPGFTQAHLALARLYARVGDVVNALRHERAAAGYSVPEPHRPGASADPEVNQ